MLYIPVCILRKMKDRLSPLFWEMSALPVLTIDSVLLLGHLPEFTVTLMVRNNNYKTSILSKKISTNVTHIIVDSQSLNTKTRKTVFNTTLKEVKN